MGNNEEYYDYCTCDDKTFLEWEEGICPYCAHLDEIDAQPCGCGCGDDCGEDCGCE